MIYYSFIQINCIDDLDYFEKEFDFKDFKNVVRGLYNKQKYTFFPELNVLINRFNEKEFYFLERKKNHE